MTLSEGQIQQVSGVGLIGLVDLHGLLNFSWNQNVFHRFDAVLGCMIAFQ